MPASQAETTITIPQSKFSHLFSHQMCFDAIMLRTRTDGQGLDKDRRRDKDMLPNFDSSHFESTAMIRWAKLVVEMLWRRAGVDLVVWTSGLRFAQECTVAMSYYDGDSDDED